MTLKSIHISVIFWLLLFVGFSVAHGQSVAVSIIGSANGQQLAAANAGSDISQYSSTFSMTAATPLIGTGTWSIVSGTATITDPSSATTTVTGVQVGETVLRWTVSFGNCLQSADVKLKVIPAPTVSIKVFLEGPFNGSNLMNDNLRNLNLIPLIEPYTALMGFKSKNGGGNEVTDATVLGVTGDNAIIDWIFLELRAEAKPDSVSGTRSALLQANGNVVDVDGISPIRFNNLLLGNYFITVRHRNHLTIKTDYAVALSSVTTLIDFTTKTNFVSSSKTNEINNFKVMRGGDLNADENITAFDVLKVRLANSVVQSNTYTVEDVNMDGQTTAFDILIVRKNNKSN
jgi:hypothetical protein